MNRLDAPHDSRCPVARGADPDLCGCDQLVIARRARPVTQADHRRMHVLWRKAGVVDRARRLELTGLIVGRVVASSSDLRDIDVRAVLGRLAYLDGAGELKTWAAGGPS